MGDAVPKVKRFPRLALAFGLTLIVAAGAVIVLRPGIAVWGSAEANAQRIVVLPFRTPPSLSHWSAEAFAESLAVQLRAIPALDARVGQGAAAEADYVLEGDVAGDSGRVAIALRLRPAGQRAASWSATFWRQDLADSTLAGDLARAVAEALQVTRR